MWHETSLFLTTIVIILLASVDAFDSSKAIATTLANEGGMLSAQAYVRDASAKGHSKFALGLHLAPNTFPHDNPFNITEDHALEYGIKLIPVDKEHWNTLVNITNLNDSAASETHNLQRTRREIDPPNPTDWCTPNKNPSQCTFGAWCHEISRKDVPNRAWVFYNDCELTGDLHPWAWGSWEDVYSGLPWVTVFYVHPMYRPRLKYAGREWNNYAKGWELYYPYGTDGQYYYRRYFDCSS
ncbi:hypothetical protein CkaCkLH20_01103 [Colletotrichum karsti]|uniref:Uncharacterized protein n=1 Tax=Colletotrichum karsti TaxID=1095194 RepID=A0A9P6LR61_9PEZI|nr:uncharacterized protein CkaCkLH20_01103 [Colletotrichum karsti]KAF9881957.1 hypothetical protein CkaCkLH20_01103 [Colletotrichum karsti]